MAGHEVEPRDLRVSDAEREHVAVLLQKAVGRGLITLDEFTERTDVALAARTRAELNSVLVDLPDVRHADVAPAATQPLMLRTGAGSVKQNGHWVVPTAINVECGMGNITLDFTEAICPHHEVTLDATVGSGNITVIVPRGWHVVMEEAISGMGNIMNKATDPPKPGLPVLRVHGRVRMGHLKIRYPRGRA
ncbi:MAG TPA: DUF1707 domain-containing protein [Pseudonocardiaceae bacterium]